MTNILDLPGDLQRISPISVREYHRLEEHNANGRRTELIRGIILEKPRRSPRHTLHAVSYSKLAERVTPEGFSVRVNAPLTFRDSEPKPDLATVTGSDEDYAEEHPSTAVLVIEVTDGDGELERAMASIYAEASVEEYWIKLVAQPGMEVYRRPVNGQYQERMTVEAGTVTCARLSEMSVTLGSWPPDQCSSKKSA